jgi:hypothetical protein
MQAIITKYCGPTNTRGSRYRATAQWGSITISARCELSDEQNHIHACRCLRDKIIAHNGKQYAKHGWKAETDPWNKPMVCGQLPDGSYAHVFMG